MTIRYVDVANPSAGNGTLGNPFKLFQAGVNAAVFGDVVSIAGGTYNEAITLVNSGVSIIGQTSPWGATPVLINGGITRSNGILFTGKTNILIDGIKVYQTTGEAIYGRGPSLSTIEIRNCYLLDCGASGIAIWGVTYGNDPAANNFRNAQVIRIHHNKIERCCNSNVGAGFNEQITCANGVYDLKIFANEVGPAVVGGGYAVASGGEGIDVKESVELFEIYGNRIHDISKNPIYADAGRCQPQNGYTLPSFLKNGRIYNNLIYNNSGHGITVTAEIQTDSVADVTGRKGGYVDGIEVSYNTVFGQVAAGFLAYDRGVTPGTSGWTNANVPIYNNVQWINNIFHGNATGGTYTDGWWDHKWATNCVVKKNIATTGVSIRDGAPTLTGNIAANPLFTNQAAADFTLTATSPALNIGGDAAITPTTDFVGFTRTAGAAPDAGALERQTTTPTSVSVARGATLDTRAYVPYLKNAFPAQSMVIGTAVNIDSSFYIAEGTNPAWTMTAIPGLSINASSGQITGNVTTAGTTSFRITCTTAQGAVSTAAVNWVVATTLNWATAINDPAVLQQGSFYDLGPLITGTPASITDSITLPTGVTIEGPPTWPTWRYVAASNATVGTFPAVIDGTHPGHALTLNAAASSDWTTRSSDANVVAAYDFSAAPANGGTAFFGSLRANPKISVDTSYTNAPGELADYSAVRVIDTTQFPPGSTASLRWDVPTNSGERGDWWRLSIDNYADQFGNGAPNGGEFWLQWRERMNPTYATYQFKAHDPGIDAWNNSYTNYKHIIITRGMQTPYASEAVNHSASTYYGYTAAAPNGGNGGGLTQALTNTQTGDYSGELVLRAFDSGLNASHPGQFKYPGMYHNKVFFSRFTVGGSGSTLTEQNNGDLTSSTVKACQYVPSSGGSGDNFTDYTTCFSYPSNQWFSVMMHVNLGPYSTSTTSTLDPGLFRGYSNSTIELYGQITPGTAWRLIHKRTGVCLCTTGVSASSAGDPGTEGIDRIGIFGWLTFMTNKWSGESHPLAQRWISQVILSKGSTMPAAPAV